MKALVLERPDSFPTLTDWPTPEPKEGQIIVDIKAAALNRRDYWITKGQYPGIELPVILGSDGAGTVENREVIINPSLNWGDNAKVQQKDYKILGLPDPGTFAEKVCVPEVNVFTKPSYLTMEQAAALPLAGLTAYRAVFTKGQLINGQRVLISGVGGGVAMFACQMSICAGCEVWVTSGREDKIEKAIQKGAKGGVNYKEDDWYKKLSNQVPEGFDLIIDSAGGPGFKRLIDLAAPAGKIVIYGGTRGKFPEISPQKYFGNNYKLLVLRWAPMKNLIRC